MIDINDAWYRISAKAIVYNENGDILLCKESNGVWDIPGGWLDHGENVLNCIERELKEEMGLEASSISPTPECFITAFKEWSKSRPWISNICYKVTLKNLEFRRSDECEKIAFFNKDTIWSINALINVQEVFKVIFKD